MPKADGATSARRGRVRIAALIVLALVAVVIYLIDQGTKALVLANLSPYERVPLIGELLQLYLVKNAGAAFSLGSGMTWIFAIIASAVVIFIVIFAHRIKSLGWAALFGLLLGGNAGNLTDRLFREPGFGVGHVIDFFQLYAFPAIFNVADVAIVSSMVIFVILTLRGIGLDGSRASRKNADAAAPDSTDEIAVDREPA